MDITHMITVTWMQLVCSIRFVTIGKSQNITPFPLLINAQG